MSAPTIDHFVVYLGNNDKGWKVYDPLTNPTLIFDLDEYRREILPSFKPLARPKDKVEVVIKAPLVTLFLEKAVQALSILQSELKPSCQLMLSSDYSLWLQSRNISDAARKTEDAYNELVNVLHQRNTFQPA